MTLTETAVVGLYLVEYPRRSDERGYFSRVWCSATMEERGLSPQINQINSSFCARKGTLRGLHLQAAPAQEVKITQCLQGSIFNVAVDLRPESPTYRKWYGVELNQLDGRQLYVPEGCAHGYQATSDNTLVQYSTSAPYAPESEYGIRWDDPAINIDWPLTPVNVTEKDNSWPLLEGH